MNEPFVVALDDTLTRLACLVCMAGALCVGLLDWQVLGCVLLVFGGLFLWLAHEFAVASPYPDAALSPSSSLEGKVPQRGQGKIRTSH